MRMHRLAPTRLRIIYFTIAYATAFYAWYIYNGNTEFAWYLLEFFGFIALTILLLKLYPNLPDSLVYLVSFVGLLHVVGGLDIEGVRIYGAHLFTLYDGGTPDLYIFKYDQLIHFVGYGVLALAFRALLRRFAPEMHRLPRNVVAILSACGFGALNEISEFVAMLLFRHTGVGGVYNTELDLCFNLVGSLSFVLVASFVERLKKRR